MNHEPLPLLDQLILFASTFFAWAAGESGRIWIAGGAGGAIRWAMLARRRLRDGAVYVATGAIVAHYLWPWAQSVMTMIFGAMPDNGNTAATAGFVTGMLGMSAAKIIVAVVEARANKLGGGDEG